MKLTHFLLVLLVVLVWGINFLFVKFALDEVSPLTLCAIRFVLASVPAIFFIKKPEQTKVVAAYGIVMFALQFSLLFIGMRIGMTPGMASLLMQVQVFFSILFAAFFLGEIPYIWQIAGAIVSFTGIGIVAAHVDNQITIAGFLFILAGAATWGVGNLIIKKAPHANMLAVVIWGSFYASLPMVLVALLFNGPQSFVSTYQHLSGLGLISMLYITYVSTWVGYGVWNWLVSRYPISMIVPFSLMIPIIAMISSVLVLGESFPLWKGVASLFVMGGLCINLLGARFIKVPKPVQQVVAMPQEETVV